MDSIRQKIVQKLKATGSAFYKGLKRLFFILPFVLLLCGVVLCLGAAIVKNQIAQGQSSQSAAQRWGSGSGRSFVQISLFGRGQGQAGNLPPLVLDSSLSLQVSDIKGIREKLEEAIQAAAELDAEKRGVDYEEEATTEEGKRLWVDAYSSEGKFSLQKDAKDGVVATQAEAVLTGFSGDFSLIHPMILVDGSFISEDDLDHQRIVLDEGLAWQLFGSNQVSGQSLKIGSRDYTVAGVVRTGQSQSDQRSYGDLPRGYILFSELVALSKPEPDTNVTSPAPSSQGELAILCYEVILPEPLKGIGEQNVISAVTGVGKKDSDFILVENSGRFGFLALYNTLFPIGETKISQSGFQFPFWELSAQLAEQSMLFWWNLMGIGLLTIALSSLAVYSSIRWRRAGGGKS